MIQTRLFIVKNVCKLLVDEYINQYKCTSVIYIPQPAVIVGHGTEGNIVAPGAGGRGSCDGHNGTNHCRVVLEIAAYLEQFAFCLLLVGIAYVLARRMRHCCSVCGAHFCCFQQRPKQFVDLTEFRQHFPLVIRQTLHCLFCI